MSPIKKSDEIKLLYGKTNLLTKLTNNYLALR